jgi:hypothetical protein
LENLPRATSSSRTSTTFYGNVQTRKTAESLATTLCNEDTDMMLGLSQAARALIPALFVGWHSKPYLDKVTCLGGERYAFWVAKMT